MSAYVNRVHQAGHQAYRYLLLSLPTEIGVPYLNLGPGGAFERLELRHIEGVRYETFGGVRVIRYGLESNYVL